MDFFFSADKLNRAVPEETRIIAFTAEAYPDGRRVKVNAELTPYQVRPYLDVSLRDANGEQVASTTIAEPMSWKLQFTLHLRAASINNPYTLTARLYYPDGPSAEPVHFSLDINPHHSQDEPDSDHEA